MQTAASCKAKGAPQVDVHGVDLSESAQTRKFADDVLEKYGDVNVLVNNAGMGPASGGGPIKGKNFATQKMVMLLNFDRINIFEAYVLSQLKYSLRKSNQ